MFGIHPSLLLIAGALLVLILPVRLRHVGLLAAPLALLAVLSLDLGTTWTQPFLRYELVVLRVDELARVFATIFALIATLSVIFALHVKTRGEHIAALMYAAGSLGVVFAGDWLTLFFCWEVMAASSVFLIWYRGTRESLAAGFRYILIHFLGGNILLGGVLLLMSQGTIAVTSLTGTGGLAYWLVLIGVGINSVIVPLHAWLTDAYPEGTVTGSVFLSALTTKVAVCVLLRVFPGTELLIWAGVIMTIYGVIFAILENDTRRLLAYHIVSQVGFMVAGVGIGTDLALNGSTAHAYSHILYKALLFMGAGAVIYATGRRKLSDLGGLYKTMPLTAVCFTIAAMSISGVPLFNGFISKSITIYAAEKDGLALAALGMHVASIGTFLSINLKMVYYMFFGKDAGLEPKKLPWNMSAAMALTAFLCFLYGVYPWLLYDMLPFAMQYVPFTANKVIGTVQLLLAASAAFWLVLPKLKLDRKISLDFDWFYRGLLSLPFEWLMRGMRGVKGNVDARGGVFFEAVAPYVHNPV
ncbi:MAG: Na(+)/H(+) antiporter subunit D, partial [Candidatus Desulforudis sp.]|nr:Na(+)/H(+) antiporter subunit D [Desulforudis sp.]